MSAFRPSIAAACLALLVVAPGVNGSDSTPRDLPPEMQFAPLPLQVPEPADNPGTPAKVALGRLLFFDPILSGTRTVACATCHNPRFAWTDGRATPVGVGGAGLGPNRVLRDPAQLPAITRNTPSIINTAFNGLVSGVAYHPEAAPMFWDSHVSGLEAQVLVPIRALEEMRGTNCSEAEAIGEAVRRVRGVTAYEQQFRAVFGGNPDEAVTAHHLAQAIAAFERSLVSPRSPFDRFLRGDTHALNAEQQRGLQVFQKAGCIFCHGGPMLSDFKLHFIGVSDATPGGRREFRTPTLRNLGHTAPYMHNGSQRTIEDVLNFYEQLSDAVAETLDGGDHTAQPPLDPLLQRLNLVVADFPALEAFLRTLDEEYDVTIPASVPSGLPVAGSPAP